MSDDDDPNDRCDGSYKVGKGRPPLHTRFKPGNPGRRKGSGNRKQEDFAERLRRSLAKPMKVRKGGEVVDTSVPELLAERLKALLVSSKARDLEVAVRIIQTHVPDLLKQTQQEVRVVYERARESKVPLPSRALYKAK